MSRHFDIVVYRGGGTDFICDKWNTSPDRARWRGNAGWRRNALNASGRFER